MSGTNCFGARTCPRSSNVSAAVRCSAPTAPARVGGNQSSYESEVGAVNTNSGRLRDELGVGFSRACAQLAEGRLGQDVKDTSGNRAAVVECWTRIDAVLDMYLLDGQLR